MKTSFVFKNTAVGFFFPFKLVKILNIFVFQKLNLRVLKYFSLL